MTKKVIIIINFILPLLSYSQVGINTETPQKTLHVNGSMQITNEFNVGGTEDTKGNSGNNNQLLFSQGEDKPPLWSSLEEVNIPVEAGFVSKDIVQSITSSKTSIKFNKIVIDLKDYSIIQLNNSNAFKIVKSGYYQITSFIHYNISRAGTATTTLVKNNTDISNVTGSSSLSNIDHNTTTTIFLEKDDIISLNASFSTSGATVSIANLSLQFLGK
jgi:hypothetical protein